MLNPSYAVAAIGLVLIGYFCADRWQDYSRKHEACQKLDAIRITFNGPSFPASHPCRPYL